MKKKRRRSRKKRTRKKNKRFVCVYLCILSHMYVHISCVCTIPPNGRNFTKYCIYSSIWLRCRKYKMVSRHSSSRNKRRRETKKNTHTHTQSFWCAIIFEFVVRCHLYKYYEIHGYGEREKEKNISIKWNWILHGNNSSTSFYLICLFQCSSTISNSHARIMDSFVYFWFFLISLSFPLRFFLCVCINRIYQTKTESATCIKICEQKRLALP